MMLFFGLFVGAGGGGIDTGANIYVARRHGSSAMFWLHACYGIGATLGPLVMTAVLNATQPWQVGYAIGGGTQLVMSLAFIALVPLLQNVSPSAGQDVALEKPKRTPLTSTLRLPMVLMSILIYVVYTGSEVSAGVLGYTLFTEGRGIPLEEAGVWVSFYWGSFTVGRIFAGFITRVVNETAYIRLSMLASVIFGALIWWNPSQVVSLIGLAGYGFALAPLFPALMTSAEARVGAAHAPNTIGLQVGAGSIGVAFGPAIIGFIAQRTTLEVIPVALTIGAFLILALHEVILLYTPKPG
jgi:fucose permease